MDTVISALTRTGLRSPLQATYPESATGGLLGQDSVLDRYKSHAEKFSRDVLKDGVTLPSTSEDIAKGADPLPVGRDEWYGVGGARDHRSASGDRVPERVLQTNQFTRADALGHILDVEDHNDARQRSTTYAPSVFAGGWNETGADGQSRVGLDHSLALRDKGTALKMAREVGERAIFDAKNIQDIDTGTSKPKS